MVILGCLARPVPLLLWPAAGRPVVRDYWLPCFFKWDKSETWSSSNKSPCSTTGAEFWTWTAPRCGQQHECGGSQNVV
jgi:hypothetical protein